MDFYKNNEKIIKYINFNYRLRYRNSYTKENKLIGAGVSNQYFDENLLLNHFYKLQKEFPTKSTLWNRKHIKIEFQLK